MVKEIKYTYIAFKNGLILDTADSFQELSDKMSKIGQVSKRLNYNLKDEEYHVAKTPNLEKLKRDLAEGNKVNSMWDFNDTVAIMSSDVKYSILYRHSDYPMKLQFLKNPIEVMNNEEWENDYDDMITGLLKEAFKYDDEDHCKRDTDYLNNQRDRYSPFDYLTFLDVENL